MGFLGSSKTEGRKVHVPEGSKFASEGIRQSLCLANASIGACADELLNLRGTDRSPKASWIYRKDKQRQHHYHLHYENHQYAYHLLPKPQIQSYLWSRTEDQHKAQRPEFGVRAPGGCSRSFVSSFCRQTQPNHVRGPKKKRYKTTKLQRPERRHVWLSAKLQPVCFTQTW